MERKVTVIPAKPREKIHKESKQLRVAAYCRVSTDQEDQSIRVIVIKVDYIW